MGFCMGGKHHFFKKYSLLFDSSIRDVPRFRRVVATTDMRSSIKCVYAHCRGAFVLVGD